MRRFVCVMAVLAGAAWADIPPTDTSGCNGKAVGDACKRDDGTAASCVKSTCSRNDYSNGPPPTSVSSECLVCSGAPPAEKKSSCTAVPAEGVLGLLALVFLRRRAR